MYCMIGAKVIKRGDLANGRMEMELSRGGSMIKTNCFAALNRGYLSNGFSQLDNRGVKESWLTLGRFDRRVSQLQCSVVQCSVNTTVKYNRKKKTV